MVQQKASQSHQVYSTIKFEAIKRVRLRSAFTPVVEPIAYHTRLQSAACLYTCLYGQFLSPYIVLKIHRRSIAGYFYSLVTLDGELSENPIYRQ